MSDPSLPSSARDIEEFIRELQQQLHKDVDTLTVVGSSDDGRDDRQNPFISTSQHEKSSPSRNSRVSSRYEIMEGIAAGGMGVVYRAHDRLLDREVALKVLSAGRDSEVLLQRFVTESRVLAQLQHPGIPPVHEEGWLPDGRAFIAMKLVRGQTLRQLLDARPSPEVDLVKFLGIFRQVCEALAFAHSQGILHRDLKPENVMVGAFGEVQVIDWGLAKCTIRSTPADESECGNPGGDRDSGMLRSPASPSVTLPGGVIGTPAYMPPEQANGDHEQVGSAADVFSLGGILTTILTGEPPFLGNTASQLVAASRSAAVNDVHQRLRTCHADVALKDLAIRCLQADPADRPQTAGEIVTELDAHLESMQDRLWEMELSYTKEYEARRRRRLNIALLVSASLLVAVVSGSWSLMTMRTAARQRQAVTIVSGAMGEAQVLRDQALAVPLADAQSWDAALLAARRAEMIARQADDPALLENVLPLVHEVEIHSAAAARDREFVAALTAANRPVSIVEVREYEAAHAAGEDLAGPQEPPKRRPRPTHDEGNEHNDLQDRRFPDFRRRPPRGPGLAGGHHHTHTGPGNFHRPPPGFHRPPHGKHSHRHSAHVAIIRERYVNSLSSYGIRMAPDSEHVAIQRIQESPVAVRNEVISGLHRWLGVMSWRRGHASEADIEWVLHVLAAIDDDPHREQIRQLIREGDTNELQHIAQQPEVLEQPPPILWLLAKQLPSREESRVFLRRAQLRHPDSMIIMNQLADDCMVLGDDEQAIETFLSVLAIDESAQTYVCLARLLEQADRIEDAILICRNAIRIAPDNSDGYPILARILLNAERPQEALEVASEGLAILPAESDMHFMLMMSAAEANVEIGNVQAAREAYQRILRADGVPAPISDRVQRVIDQMDAPQTTTARNPDR